MNIILQGFLTDFLITEGYDSGSATFFGSLITQGLGTNQYITSGYISGSESILVGDIITQGMGTIYYITQGYQFGGILPPGELEAIAYNSLVIRIPTDSGIGIDSIGVTSDVTPSQNTLVDVYWGILNNLSNAGFIPENSWTYVINPESPEDPWPNIPVPFVMIEPLSCMDNGNQVGAGRFGVVWDVEFKIHIVVGQILDQAWQDPNIITSYDQMTGPLEIVDKVVNVLCQSYPLNPMGQPVLIELPYVKEYSSPYRNKKASDYTTVSISFRCTFNENLPDTLP